MVLSAINKTVLYCSPEMIAKYYEANNSFFEKTVPLSVVEVINGVVHPLELSALDVTVDSYCGGVTDEALNFVGESLTKRIDPLDQSYVNSDWYIGANRNRIFDKVDYVDDDVVFIGALSKHYGHFILEGLARLWFFLETENLKFKCVYISENGIDPFVETFGLFGIDPKKLQKIDIPTRFRKVLIPEPSIRLSDYYHLKYNDTLSRIRDKVSPRSFEKVYFSKEGISNSRAVGEDFIQNVFVSNGFHVFHPEKMTMYEKIAVLRGARVFVASSGTNVHNSVFLEDQCECICLNRSAHYYAVQFMIDIMKKLNSTYVDVYIVPNRRRNFDPIGPFLLGPTKYLIYLFKSKGYGYSKYKLYRALPLSIMAYANVHLRSFFYLSSWRAYNKFSNSEYSGVKWMAKTLLNIYIFARGKARSILSQLSSF